MAPAPDYDDRIRIGVSACLLGRAVRYDGGHKRDAFLVDTFGRWVEWVPVCPEVELGLGVPRPTLRLQRPRARPSDAARLVMPQTGVDYTRAMRTYAARRAAALAHDDLCGYILKKDSPSCGMERVKVYGGTTAPSRSGRGLFATALLQRFPNLPVDEEGRLNDPHLRDNFVERVFAYRRLRRLFAGRWTVGDLLTFHTAHRLQLLTHQPDAYGRIARALAAAKPTARTALRDTYEAEFMDALKVIATPRRHVNVLRHIAGSFTNRLEAASRRELAELIDDYRRGLLPLVVPITLLRHYVRRFAIASLAGQVYLELHPKELMLRNHV